MNHATRTGRPPAAPSKWRNAPAVFIAAGGALSLLGLLVNRQQFAFSWLLAFMFWLSLCLGALFLVMAHHLFDAGWSVPLRRFNEQIAGLVFPWMALFFVPVALLSGSLYQWMRLAHPALNHSVHAKWPLFTLPGYCIASAVCLLVWWVLAHRLRAWSIRQDHTGAAECTYKMRFYSGWGIFAYALTVTLAAFIWMSGLEYDWYSTMYGVYYFAGGVWTSLAVAYVITVVLQRRNVLPGLVHGQQYYFLGSLLFAFTVFYAYIHFAQYFVIWNANMPEETFWYVVRENGSWWWIGLIIIFGHFFVPFLALLRIDVKNIFPYMIPLCVWVFLMQYVDMSFNVMPPLHQNGFPLKWVWLDFGCLAFMGGVLGKVFLARFAAAAPFPIKDPRLAEAIGHPEPAPARIAPAELDDAGGATGAAGAGPVK